MNRKEVFMNFVFLGAIARDLSQGTRDSQLIALRAERIPAEQIPLNPLNAAKVFLAFIERRTAPHRWMLGAGGGR